MAKSDRIRIPKFVIAGFKGGALTIVRIISGFARSKYSALVFGTVGVGLLAQGNQFGMLAITFGSFSMAVGIIARLRANTAPEQLKQRRQICATAFSTQLFLSLVFTAATLIFIKPITLAVFGDLIHVSKILPLALAIPFGVLASSHIEGITFGFDRYDLYIRASVLATLASVAIFFPLAIKFGLTGAFWGIFFVAFFQFAFALYYSTKIQPLRETLRFGFDFQEFLALLRFGGVMLVSGAATYGSSLLIRRIIIGQLGEAAAGIMQVPIALTAYYTPFLTNPLWGRLHPFVSREADSVKSRRELTTSLRYTMLFSTAIIISLMVLHVTFVRIAYSTSFLAARELIPLQLAGDFFYFIAFTFSVYFLGLARLRVYLLGWILYFGLQIALTLALLPTFGLPAVQIAYLTSNVCAAMCAIIWLVTHSPAKVSLQLFKIFSLCVAGLFAAYQLAPKISPDLINYVLKLF
jgi:O-antigen/teichoic acid export membrane protein